MKHLDKLLIIFAIFIVLACRCNTSSFGSRQSRTYSNSTNYGTPKPLNNSSTPNLADLGEYKQCSERETLKHAPTRISAPLTINNGSKVTISLYRLGPNTYDSIRYETLTPGKSVTLRLPVRGEWWMITDVNGKCQMIVAPPNTVNIK